MLYILSLTLSWRRPLSYRNQSIDLLRKSMDWFLYDNALHHEWVNKKITEQVMYALFTYNKSSKYLGRKKCNQKIHHVKYRSNGLQMFFKIGFLKNFANFIGKELCWSLFFAFPIIEKPVQWFALKINELGSIW